MYGQQDTTLDTPDGVSVSVAEGDERGAPAVAFPHYLPQQGSTPSGPSTPSIEDSGIPFVRDDSMSSASSLPITTETGSVTQAVSPFDEPTFHQYIDPRILPWSDSGSHQENQTNYGLQYRYSSPEPVQGFGDAAHVAISPPSYSQTNLTQAHDQPVGPSGPSSSFPQRFTTSFGVFNDTSSSVLAPPRHNLSMDASPSIHSILPSNPSMSSHNLSRAYTDPSLPLGSHQRVAPAANVHGPPRFTRTPYSLPSYTHVPQQDMQPQQVNLTPKAPPRRSTSSNANAAPPFMRCPPATVNHNNIRVSPPQPQFQSRQLAIPSATASAHGYHRVGRAAQQQKHSWSTDSGIELFSPQDPIAESYAALPAPNAVPVGLGGRRPVAVELPGQAYVGLMEEIPQTPYREGNKKADAYGIPDSVIFYPPCRLDLLLDRNVSSLSDPDAIPFPLSPGGLSPKSSFRFRFRDHHRYDRQVNVSTTKNGISLPPTKERLAKLAAREMEKFLKNCEAIRRPFGYRLEELYLISIEHAGKASLQPRVGIRKA